MKAEIVLTPSESKRLIAKAVAQLDSVKSAYKNGTLIICRGGTNAYVYEEVTGEKMDKEQYLVGYIGPKGLQIKPHTAWEVILYKGKPKTGATISEVMKDLRPGDVIIKGANAIGPDMIPGLLCARRRPDASGGTLGQFMLAAMARGVEIVIPVGLEKCIPVSVLVGSKEISSSVIDYARGYPCALIPMFGTVVTEVDALKKLTGAEAIPISAGGIGGAEGSIVLLVTGGKKEVGEAIKIVEGIQGEPNMPDPKQD